MIIESIGLPCSGKTYNYLNLKKKLNTKIFSYIDIYYIYLEKIFYLNLIQSLFFKISYRIYKKNIKNINFYNTGISENNKFILYSYVKKILKKILTINEDIIKKNFLKKINFKEKKILKIFYKCVSRSPLNLNEKKKLKDRVDKEFIALILIKKIKLNKLVVINDEGFLQRILTGYERRKSLYENKNKMLNYLKKFQNFIKINFFIMTKTNLNKILKRAKIRKKGFKYDNFSHKELKKWNKLFDNFFLESNIRIYRNVEVKKIANLIKIQSK